MAYLIGSIIAFSVVILIHEGGHFLAAKAVDMKVNEFALGMGPKLFGVQKGETLYTLRAFPIGGYIKPEGEDTKSDHPRAFGNKPLWARAAVVSAGPISNFVLAFVLIVGLITFAGVPLITIDEVLPDTPAARAGIKPGDVVKSIDGKNIYLFEELVDIVDKTKGTTLNLKIIRNGKELSMVMPTMYSEELKRNIIGIRPVPKMTFYNYSYLENFKHSFLYSFSLFKQIEYWFKRLFAGQVSKDEIGGPVKIISISGTVAKLGIPTFIHFIALLSLSLGIFNLFPIPALDGGRLVFFAVEGIRGRPIDPKKEAAAHLVGFLLLIVLLIVVTYNDIKSL